MAASNTVMVDPVSFCGNELASFKPAATSEERAFVMRCASGWTTQDAPVVQALALLRATGEGDELPPSKRAVDVILDLVNEVLQSSPHLWTPVLHERDPSSTTDAGDLMFLWQDQTSYIAAESQRQTDSAGIELTDARSSREEVTRVSTQGIGAEEGIDSPITSVSRQDDVVEADHLILNEENARWYRKKIEVHAFRCGGEVEVEKAWGHSKGGPRDWLIVSQLTDIYLCEESVFAKTYEPVPGKSHLYRKIGRVLARQLSQHVDIQMSPQVPAVTGEPGDYLVQSEAAEQWVVPQLAFESTYTLIEVSEDYQPQMPSRELSVQLSDECRTATEAHLQSFSTDWTFDVFKLEHVSERHALYFAAKHVFSREGFVSEFDINEESMDQFLLEVEALYPANPFHNSVNAAHTLHALDFVVQHNERDPGLRALLQRHELFALYLGAIIAYAGHTGYSNSFHSKTSSQLALLYNDESITENHSCALAFRIANKLSLFSRIPEALKRKIRTCAISCVLGLDNRFHFATLQQWTEDSRHLAADKDEHRLLLCKVLLKVAITAHPAKAQHQSQVWLSRLTQEMHNQGDYERSLGVAISPFMDRTKHETDNFACTYITWLVRPLFTSVAKNLRLKDADWQSNMEDNLKFHKKSSAST